MQRQASFPQRGVDPIGRPPGRSSPRRGREGRRDRLVWAPSTTRGARRPAARTVYGRLRAPGSLFSASMLRKPDTHSIKMPNTPTPCSTTRTFAR